MVISHPDHSAATLQNDIGLLKLSETVSLSTYTPVCLPAASADYTGKTGWITGERRDLSFMKIFFLDLTFARLGKYFGQPTACH